MSGLFGPDYYHKNFGDQPLPLDRILIEDRIGFVILKYSEGTAYGDWAIAQGERVRASRAVLGGYHMLSGPSGSGTEQARYFLSKYKPQRGDIVPIVDFEGAGQYPGWWLKKGHTCSEIPLAAYKAKLLDFIEEIHDQGLACMLYGHATVKAAFSDWRSSEADYWWVPGSEPHADVGPRGPDLWQYGPYTHPDGHPSAPAGNEREDISKIVTSLPLVGGPTEGDEDMGAFEDIRAGSKASRNGEALPADANDAFVFGYNLEKRITAAAAPSSESHPADGLTRREADELYATAEHEHDVKRTGPPL